MFTVSQGPNRPSCDYNPESDKLGLVTIDDVKEKGKRLLNFSPEYLKLLFVRFCFIQTNYPLKFYTSTYLYIHNWSYYKYRNIPSKCK